MNPINEETKPEQNKSTTNQKISRRRFIDWIIQGGLFTAIAGMILPALAYLWPVTKGGPASSSQEVGDLDSLPIWGSKKVAVGGSAVILIRTPKEVKAFSAICTHLGCLVEWEQSKKQILCPCHAGFFDINGQVISGPPPKALASLKVNVLDNKIFVTL